ALEDIDEFVAVEMPVALGRPGSGGESEQRDADLVQPGRFGEPLAFAPRTGIAERLRVAGTDVRYQRRDVEFLGHPALPFGRAIACSVGARLGRNILHIVGQRVRMDRAETESGATCRRIEPGERVLHPVDVVAVREILPR